MVCSITIPGERLYWSIEGVDGAVLGDEYVPHAHTHVLQSSTKNTELKRLPYHRGVFIGVGFFHPPITFDTLIFPWEYRVFAGWGVRFFNGVTNFHERSPSHILTHICSGNHRFQDYILSGVGTLIYLVLYVNNADFTTKETGRNLYLGGFRCVRVHVYVGYFSKTQRSVTTATILARPGSRRWWRRV